jgi:two-component system phosphate regulon sensor histidine kinase PhoR
MLSSRLFLKLLLVFAGLNVAAALLFGYMFSHSWSWGLATFGFVAVLAASCWFAQHIVRPVKALVDAAEALASGDYRHRAYVANRDELATLARALNRMSDELNARVKQLGQTGDHQLTVLSGMIEGVIAVDQRQRIVLANRAAGRLFAFRPSAVEGRPLLEVLRNHAVHEAVSAALFTGQPQRLEARSTAPYPSGSLRPGSGVQHVDIHVQPLPGQPCSGVVLVMHDTTELRRLESLRRDFIANVSHELKTPLSSIKAYAETLRNGAVHDPDTAQKFLARIDEQADRLHHLILDMLMLARLESDQQVFDIGPVNLPEIVERCLEDHRPAAAAKHIALAVDGGPAPCQVSADREGLREILNNLVDNAIKYTPEGGRVSLSWIGDGLLSREQLPRSEAHPSNTADSAVKDRPLVQINVRDTGIGIKAEHQPRVFERFYRVDKARSRELGGTGLGLSIVKHLVQSFGGTVHVESEQGKGSTFIVKLPSS